jgi:membrane protease YdiL (CAAX protease family)
MPVVIVAPISEELFFRGLFQDVLLKRIPSFFMRQIAPGKETILDTKIAKAARVLLTAAAFSYAHIGNESLATLDSTGIQLFSTFVLGIGFSALKESKAGMPGAIGAHFINNFLVVIPDLIMTC